MWLLPEKSGALADRLTGCIPALFTGKTPVTVPEHFTSRLITAERQRLIPRQDNLRQFSGGVVTVGGFQQGFIGMSVAFIFRWQDTADDGVFVGVVVFNGPSALVVTFTRPRSS